MLSVINMTNKNLLSKVSTAAQTMKADWCQAGKTVTVE